MQICKNFDLENTTKIRKILCLNDGNVIIIAIRKKNTKNVT